MTKTESIAIQYKNSIRQLEDVLGGEKNPIYRDSAIKRFELTYDLAWKNLKAFLESRHGIICASPVNCFKEAFSLKIIPDFDRWNLIIKTRNLTVHTYSEDLAEAVYISLNGFVKDFDILYRGME